MGSTDRLKRMVEDGLVLSRNRNFEYFQDPENRKILTLHRYLDALATEIREGERQNQLRLEISGDGDPGRVRIHLIREDLGLTHQAHLSQPELAVLEERLGHPLASLVPDPTRSEGSDD